MTVALSVTIWPQFLFGSAESERPTLTNHDIIFEEFQPVWSQFTNVTDAQMDDIWHVIARPRFALKMFILKMFISLLSASRGKNTIRTALHRVPDKKGPL